MGGYWSKVFNSGRKYQILMLGLDSAGKTTLIYRLKIGDVVTTIPTIGFTLETVCNKKVNLISFDVGGRCKIRPLLRHYYRQTDAVVFVVDSRDRERLDEAKDELFQTLADDELVDCPVLILANKQDLPNAMTAEEVSQKMELNDIKQKWAIFQTSVYDTISTMTGFDWLSDALESRDLQKDMVKPVAETIDDVQSSVTHVKLSLSTVFQTHYKRMKKWLFLSQSKRRE